MSLSTVLHFIMNIIFTYREPMEQELNPVRALLEFHPGELRSLTLESIDC